MNRLTQVIAVFVGLLFLLNNPVLAVNVGYAQPEPSTVSPNARWGSTLVWYDYTSGLFNARDFNPDPDIIEVVLVAQPSRIQLVPGAKTAMWTYNGVYPGPRIIGDVGDTVIVHLYNELPVETTIHWHGVEISAAMDGSTITQFPIQPGGYFRYEFKMRNPALYWYHPHIRTDKQIEKGLQAPLVMRDPNDQALLDIGPRRDRTFVLDDIALVTDPGDPDYGQMLPFALDADFLDDGEYGPAARAELIFNGRDRENNMLLVNGRGVIDPQANPERLPTIYVQNNVPERWRFVNTATGRSMRVSVPGQSFHQVATDGGLLEHPIEREPIGLVDDLENPGAMISNPDPDLGIFLAVAERAEVVFIPEGQPGDVMYLEWHDYPRGRHKVYSPGEVLPDGSVCEGSAPCFDDHPQDGKRASKRLMRIVITPSLEDWSDYSVPVNLRDIDDIRNQVDTSNLDQALPMTFGHGLPSDEGIVPFFSAVREPDRLRRDLRAEDEPVLPPDYGPAPRPFILENPEYAVWAEYGEVKYWDVVNFTGNDHPLHTHGFFFQPIHTRFVDLENPSANRTEQWDYVSMKDTIRLPRRPGGMGSSWTVTRMAVRLSDEHLPPLLRRPPWEIIAYGGEPGGIPGGWFDHCHIDHHAESGMLTFLNVVPQGFPIPEPEAN